MTRIERIRNHPVFKEINSFLFFDERFKDKGRLVSGGESYETPTWVDLIAPCSGENLDCAMFRVNLIDINKIGVEVHIEMNALGINEWETVFWGTCHSFAFFHDLIHGALGIPQYKIKQNANKNT